MRRYIGYVFLPLLLISACLKTKVDMPDVHFREMPERPSHFPEAHYRHTNNPYSKAGFELGRKLFFDPLLSVNNTVSCAGCHRQQHAFADGGEALSKGIYGRTGKRHSPAIFNMAWNTNFMWDGGVNHIEVMPLAPLTNPAEMGETIGNIVRKLNGHPQYPALFNKVFHKDSIDDQQLFFALAQYMSNLVSANAKYDKVVTGKASFTKQENEGYILYKTYCSGCHTEPLFTNNGYRNNGIDIVFSDSGRYRITTIPADMGTFKVPSLRNTAVSYPYMHDGRFATLQQVVSHYSDGVRSSPTLSPLLAGNGSPGLHLTNIEQEKIIAFLHTLTDSSFISNPYFVE